MTNVFTLQHNFNKRFIEYIEKNMNTKNCLTTKTLINSRRLAPSRLL